MITKNLAYVYLAGLIVVAVFAGLIANDRPLVIKYDGKLEFPAILQKNDQVDWREVRAEWALWPPIPFNASSTNLGEPRYRSPLSRDRKSHHRHLLGTDRLGRDIAAGLVSGTRVAVFVGLGSLAISLLLGLPLGAVAGFFGDDGIRSPRYVLLALITGVGSGGIYAYASLRHLASGPLVFVFYLLLSVGVGCCLFFLLFRGVSRSVDWLRGYVDCPVDRAVLFLVEMTVSIPGLVVLIAALSYIDRSSLLLVVLFIGLLGWTPVTRFLRAELLRVRDLPYISAARMGGVGEWRLLYRHALPNAIGPVVVVAAFMVGTSILAESLLSFLGIGVPAGQVTWGSILQQSRNQPTAWWLAVFPGLLLTLTILACNTLRRTP